MKLLLFSFSISLAMLTACGGAETHPQAATGTTAVVVQSVAATSQQWPELYEATGTVRARTTVTLSSKVMAYVQEVSAQAGDRVREGQQLITLDARDLESNVRRADAARAEVRSAIPEADNGIAAAKANLELAQATFKRIEELAAKKSVSNQEFDEASARLKGAQAAYDMARAFMPPRSSATTRASWRHSPES